MSSSQQRKTVPGSAPVAASTAKPAVQSKVAKPATTTTAATDGAKKSGNSNANYVPTRTSSAPPDEHPSHVVDQKSHFQPTKTNSILSEQSYCKALKNELKETTTPAATPEAATAAAAPVEVESKPVTKEEAPASSEVAQVQESLEQVTVSETAPAPPAGEHQESADVTEGNGETTDAQGEPNTDGANNSSGYRNYSNDYRRNNQTGRRNPNTSYNANRQSSRPNNTNVQNPQSQMSPVINNTCYDSAGNWYCYYPNFGWMLITDRGQIQQVSYSYQYYYALQYQTNAYNAAMYQQYSAYTPQQQPQQPQQQQQQQSAATTTQRPATHSNFQVSAAPATATAVTAAVTATTAATTTPAVAPVVAAAPQAEVAAPVATATPAKAAVVEEAVETPAPVAVTPAVTVAAVVAEEPATRTRKILNIKTKYGNVVDLDQLKASKEKAVETPVETPSTEPAVAETAQTPDASEIPALVDAKEPEVPVEGAVAEEAAAGAAANTSVEQASSVTRRLVPGGKAKLNQGVVVKRYTKAEILQLKPADDNVPRLLLGPIVVQGDSAPSTPHGKSGGGRGEGWQKQHAPRNRDGGRGDAAQGQDGWQRDAPLPNRKGKHVPAAPVPKRVVTDPLEVMCQEVLSMLNKITPQTFEKLSKKFLELNIINTSMLDKLVELIFEKAIGEPAFNAMYAELCLLLKEQGTSWMFFNVVKNPDTNDFFWVRDVVFPEDVAGPFYSKNDCVTAVTAEEPPALKPSTSTLNAVEYILAKNTLIKVGQSMNDTWYATYLPFESVSDDQRSQSVYNTENDARKDASASVSFRGRLAHSCEKEFEKSVTDNNKYDELEKQLIELRASRATMDQDEFEQKESEIEEVRFKIKRRMLGNIRFVGELYKTKLLNTDTMHSCIGELLGTPDHWKPVPDDQDLELLCNLLKTVGEALESKSRKMKNKTLATQFDQYFERLTTISKDKSFSARIRFTIEEVIALRANNWQARRAQEGPLKISEIHQKVQEEQTKTAAPAARQGAPSQQNNRSILSRTGDARNIPSKGGKDDRDVSSSGKSSSAARDTKQDKAAPVAAVPEKIEFNDGATRRGVGASLDEYFSGVDSTEIKAMLSESSPLHAGYLIQELLDKYFNATKANILTRVLPLLDDADLSAVLASRSKIIEVALETFEPLKTLVDTALDAKEAPERAGAVFAKLIKRGVLSLEKAKAMIEAFRQTAHVEQDYNLPEDIDSTFSRFLQAVSSSS